MCIKSQSKSLVNISIQDSQKFTSVTFSV
nr:unnamed protein product [Callosobruchus chinensis]